MTIKIKELIIGKRHGIFTISMEDAVAKDRLSSVTMYEGYF